MCSICSLNKQSIVSSAWCNECEQALCSNCSILHEDHGLISYNDFMQLPLFVREITSTCFKHREKLVNYCNKHDQPLCKKCLATEHKKCQDVKVLEDLVRNIKASVAFEDVFTCLHEMRSSSANVLKDRGNLLNELKKQKENLVKNVETRIDKLIDHLTGLKKNFIFEVETKISDIENGILETIHVLEEKDKTLENLNNLQEGIKNHCTNFQIFLSIKKIEKIIIQSRNLFSELNEKGALNNVNISVNFTKDFEDKILGRKTFADLKVLTSPGTVSIDTMKGNQAQIEVYHNSPPRLKLRKKLIVHYGSGLGCCVFPSGMVVALSDSLFATQMITVISPETFSESEIKLENYYNRYNDLAFFENNKIVVSGLSSERERDAISVIDLRTGNVMKTYRLKYTVSGMSITCGIIYVCVSRIGIVKFNINSIFKSQSIIRNDADVTDGSRIVASKDRICYTCPGSHFVTVLDSKYDIVFKYQNISLLHGPSGVAIDEHMNVYVAGYGSNNVVFISSDGKYDHQLLSKTDFFHFENPVSVNYNQDTKQLVVLNVNEWLLIYNII